MARYDYECENCKHVQEQSHGMMETPQYTCEKCSGKMFKIISGMGRPQFKGSGFYETDYKHKEDSHYG